MVLAENALQRAAGKKDGAAAARPADARLFPEMQRRTRYDGLLPHFTKAAAMVRRAQGTAAARTKRTAPHLQLLPDAEHPAGSAALTARCTVGPQKVGVAFGAGIPLRNMGNTGLLQEARIRFP